MCIKVPYSDVIVLYIILGGINMMNNKKTVMLFLMFYLLIIGGCSLSDKTKSLEETIKNKAYTFELLDSNGKTINDKFGVIYFSYHDKYFYNTSTNSLERAIVKFDDKTEEKGGLSISIKATTQKLEY